jgi:hypothetical protein
MNDADCAVIASTFADARLPIRTHRSVELCLMRGPTPLPDEILSPIANELDSKDGEVQVIAAELPSRVATHSAERFEVDAAWS